MSEADDIDLRGEFLWPKPLHGVEAKIRRAVEQTVELSEEVNRFAHSDSKRETMERNHDGTEYIGRVYFDPLPEPERWGVRVGEIIHNLRSALNGLAWQLVVVNGRIPTSRTEFPIFREHGEYRRNAGPKISGMSDAVRARIEEGQPFQLGEEKASRSALWILHYLNNIDKHRLVVPVVSAFHPPDSTIAALGPNLKLFIAAVAQHGAPLFWVKSPVPTLKVDVKLELAYSVALDVGGAVVEISEILHGLGREVEGTIAKFKGEFA